ncbi:FKBP-type peptidyl-prolyl cis-trans isomerase [Solitalea koreensis]|uniref:Peptidyl-prolyl cis-trans isomerase n=1 Tax=Solitalea koreensis TaxID=543615 RepID=A0A521CKT2_9SPHI|nr:FKBP-type peptidyl-prolyl cis-trans isomerase [Solitalea koreensis]SMO59290.1 peptidylprolyl isomerase [Solitalea koreensis]
MKAKIAILGLAIAGTLASCNKGGFKKSDVGFMYNIHTDANGEKIKEGDFVKFNMIFKTDKDSVLQSSYQMKRPFEVLVKIDTAMDKEHVMSALTMLGKGDSATFKISTDDLFKGAPEGARPKFLPKGSSLLYTIKVEDVKSKAQMETEFKAKRDKQNAIDKAPIDAYVAAKKLNVTTTASGLRYVITTPGAGDQIKDGDTVIAHYSGTLLNGTKFDSSYDRKEPATFLINEHAVIPGFYESLKLLKKGDKGVFIIPSALAYAEQGAGTIPPNSPLVFELEVIDVKAKK